MPEKYEHKDHGEYTTPAEVMAALDELKRLETMLAVLQSIRPADDDDGSVRP